MRSAKTVVVGKKKSHFLAKAAVLAAAPQLAEMSLVNPVSLDNVVFMPNSLRTQATLEEFKTFDRLFGKGDLVNNDMPLSLSSGVVCDDVRSGRSCEIAGTVRALL